MQNPTFRALMPHCPQILRCNFVPEDPIPAIVDRTLDLLTRLPARPLELPDLPAFLNPAYLIPSASGDEDSIAIQWQTLQATVYVSSNVIRCAFYTTMHFYAAPMIKYIDPIAELLEVASQLSTKAETNTMNQLLIVAKLPMLLAEAVEPTRQKPRIVEIHWIGENSYFGTSCPCSHLARLLWQTYDGLS